VWKKNPRVEGQPPSEATVKSLPKIRCVSLKVSGFAIKKKISVE
jgi:hypothetical protein